VTGQRTPPTPADTGDALDAETHWQVSEVLSRFGHIVDNQEWPYLSLVFTGDAVLDYQTGTATGLAEISQYLGSSGPWLSHHTLNTATRYLGATGEITAWSRSLVVQADGISIPGDDIDVLVPTADGWRIRSRRSSRRNQPGPAPGGQPWRTESFATWSAR
jgi:SnoaL-like domain